MGNQNLKPRKSRRRLVSFEQKELVFTQFAKWYWSLNRETMKEYANKIGVSLFTLHQWRKDPLFMKISGEIREELRNSVGPVIDKKLFKRAIEGSFPHMNLYYQLCGDLTTKVEHSHKPTDIPKDPKEVQDEIDRLTKEVGTLSKASGDSKRKKHSNSVAKIGKLIRV